MELKCTVQHYDWGKKGMNSKVAQFLKAANPEIKIDEDKPYAELWMGTHLNGPSVLKNTGEHLHEYVGKNVTILGDKVRKTFGDSLPFLFKVLSIDKALSIQAHPDKQLATNLNKLHPTIYKDSNHKPELAIALTPFKALCGFRPVTEIQNFVNTIPELHNIIGDNTAEHFIGCNEADAKKYLKKCLERILTHHSDSTASQIKHFINRLSSMDESSREMLHASILERLNADFPGDVGCFGIYFFNLIELKPGEAIYLGPNEPHAYLSGDCIECMACSDNVVRAGLTPKLKDVPTLIEMLTYQCEPGSQKLFKSKILMNNNFAQIFQPPIDDFSIIQINITDNTIKEYKMIPLNSASILLITEGKIEIDNKIYQKGSVLFLGANEQLQLKILSEKSPTVIFQASANV
ncbi:mannose-6-phosphate isomerase [Chelonus insularis]|uniref:mannose-6-phosphate isomerase n=1 Tax=Chelonus insularis TaxID=460826 RepID=UPI00158DCB7D|nr:mannose-6-phosphate isomerase [Chelonus insularis]XP_034935108.1 mannose-6-phosphate isomerase [Chelonus insularis]XP_034935109.1 mannose-6-phosphate isomerase [Chelonus insularis]